MRSIELFTLSDDVLEPWNKFTCCDSHDGIKIAVSQLRSLLSCKKMLAHDVYGTKY